MRTSGTNSAPRAVLMIAKMKPFLNQWSFFFATILLRVRRQPDTAPKIKSGQKKLSFSKPEFKPCPFCGHGVFIDIRVVNTVVLQVPKLFYVLCHQCFAQGPEMETPDEAAEMWNVRHSIF